jgi:acyl-CoA synthetase (NDP forming)
VKRSAYAKLNYVFHPRSIAVVGASRRENGPGFVSALLRGGFNGPIYPVNPKADEIEGLKCYPTLLEVPGPADYVISSVSASRVMGLLEDANKKGAKVIHLFTAGFSETGDRKRAALEQRVLERARELGIRLIGPNCMGLFYPKRGLAFNPNLSIESGTVAFISQSGANVGEFARTSVSRGLGFSKMISYGNGIDLGESDFLEYCAEDPECDVIAAYIEGVRDGRRFFRALRKAATAKPIAVLKGGRTAAGNRAAASHTAALAGSSAIFDVACRQAGAVRVDTMEQLIDMCVAFHFVRSVPGPRLCIVGGGGGRSVLAADEATMAGLEVPDLPEDVQQQLLEFTPIAGTSVRNPVDTDMSWIGLGIKGIQDTLRIISRAPNIDVLLYHRGMGNWPGLDDKVDFQSLARQAASQMANVAGEIEKPLVLVGRGAIDGKSVDVVLAFQDEAAKRGIATFPSIERAALSLARLHWWQQNRRETMAQAQGSGNS